MASLDARIVVLTAAVLLWVGGFDVLYACQDFEHDRRVGLNSVPQAFGLDGAFWIARGMHLVMIGLLCWLVVLFGLGMAAKAGVGMVAALLLYEHSACVAEGLAADECGVLYAEWRHLDDLFFWSVAVDRVRAGVKRQARLVAGLLRVQRRFRLWLRRELRPSCP